MEIIKKLAELMLSTLRVYSILIIIRILLTWVQGPYPQGSFSRLLASVVDPYLNFFRRFRLFQIGSFDFSAIAAIITLNFVTNIASSFVYSSGTFSMLTLVTKIIATLFLLASSIMMFFVFILVIRFLLTFVQNSNHNPFVSSIDALLQQVIARILGLFTVKPVSYRISLLISAAAFFLLNFALTNGGELLIALIYNTFG